MKNLLRWVLVAGVLVAIGLAVYFLVLNRPVDLQPRPPGTEGAARWAYDLAVVRARSELGTDSVLVEVIGEDVLPDGRIAANRGSWKFIFASFTAARRLPVSVDFGGQVSTAAREDVGTIRALGTPPGTFPNTIEIFAATVGRGTAGDRVVAGVVRCEFDSTAGTHVWKIPFRVGSTTETHHVRWDGVWLGSF